MRNVKLVHTSEAARDTPEDARVESLRRAMVHAHCHCAAEVGRVSSTGRGFWWVPTAGLGEESPLAVELDESDADDSTVDGWCPTHRVCPVPSSELLVQARRAQKTGQRRHMWLPDVLRVQNRK